MDTNTTPANDVVVTEDAIVVEDSPNTSFGQEVGKTLLISAATTAGMLVGGAAIVFAAKKFNEFKTRRALRHLVVDGEVDETIETPTETEN